MHWIWSTLLFFWSSVALAAGPQGDTYQAVSLNAASATELAAIEGVDESLALRIVALRDERGRLGSVEALRVLGLGASQLDALRQGTTVEVSMQVSAAPPPRRSFATVDEVLSQFDNEPDIRAVQTMVMAYTKTHPDLVTGWLRASKETFLIPRTRLTYRKELDLRDEYVYVDSDGDSIAELTDSWAENDDYYEVRLEWRLDKLVMSSERIRVINEAQDIVKLRDQVLDEVTRLYFDRRRLQVEAILSPPASLEARLRNELRLQELTANIDAYTGGEFSATLSQSRAP